MNNVIEELKNPLQSVALDQRYADFVLSWELVYNSSDFKISELVFSKESSEYSACQFQLNSTKTLFRVAKITPTKVGQFVTLWKRQKGAPIQPYDIQDDIDVFVVSVRKDDNFGQFIFPKAVLLKHGVLSANGKGGKRAIRVYPPWDITMNKQAQKTQAWQQAYFLNILGANEEINYNRAKMLLVFGM